MLMQKADSRPVSPIFYLAIALITLFAVTTFLISRTTQVQALTSPVAGLMHLKAMEKVAMPYEEAIANGKPTFLEFYADWCSSCQAMAQPVEAFRDRYGDEVNFVMLDIDDPAQAERVAEYSVTGVPHFIVLDSVQGIQESLVGRVPSGILAQTFDKLLSATPANL